MIKSKRCVIRDSRHPTYHMRVQWGREPELRIGITRRAIKIDAVTIGIGRTATENKSFLIPAPYPRASTDRQIFQIYHSSGIKIEEARVAPRKMNERTNVRTRLTNSGDRRITVEKRASIESPLTPTTTSSSVGSTLFPLIDG